MALLDWKILYADGSTFSNLDGEAWEAPKAGVMAAFYADEIDGVSVEISDQGFWIWKDGRWFAVDRMGYWDYRFHHMEPQTAIYGRIVRDEDWRGRMKGLINEIMGEPKSAWRRRETRSDG